jgi:ATP-dependent RNA helicase RhlE
VPEDYVHRIGRTARAGGSGAAVSLVAPGELPLLRAIEQLLRRTLPVSALPAFTVPAATAPERVLATAHRHGHHGAPARRRGAARPQGAAQSSAYPQTRRRV